jgi:hypothetical protein
MVRLDRDHEGAVWAECERLMGKKAPTEGFQWAFPVEIVAKARGSIGSPESEAEAI